MVKRLCTIALALTFAVACASTPRARSFAELPKHLDTGNTIRVTETSGTISMGRLAALSDTSLTLRVDDRPRDVLARDVTTIARRDRRTGLGALIGLAVGFGVTVIAARAGDSSENSLVAAQAAGAELLTGMGLGAAVGALVGYFVKHDRTVYVRPVAPVSPPPPDLLRLHQSAQYPSQPSPGSHCDVTASRLGPTCRRLMMLMHTMR